MSQLVTLSGQSVFARTVECVDHLVEGLMEPLSGLVTVSMTRLVFATPLPVLACTRGIDTIVVIIAVHL